MKIELISYSQVPPNKRANWDPAPKELVVYAARVSNPSNKHNMETADKLIRYLIKHKHWSPFEMVSASFEITTTRDIARQILRHRSFSFQEYSQRYADPTKELGFEIREARLQDSKNRQNSLPAEDPNLGIEWAVRQQEVINLATRHYNWAIQNNIAKEQARSILPEGNTVSTLQVNGTLRSWIHYIELRSEEGTQKEHREIAIALGEVVKNVFQIEN
jgi:thymidylate synthase (FAD)